MLFFLIFLSLIQQLFQGATVVTAAVVEVHSRVSQVKTMLNMTLKTDYLTMVLYSPDPAKVSWGEDVLGSSV